jgi:hypothetical protein
LAAVVNAAFDNSVRPFATGAFVFAAAAAVFVLVFAPRADPTVEVAPAVAR